MDLVAIRADLDEIVISADPSCDYSSPEKKEQKIYMIKFGLNNFPDRSMRDTALRPEFDPDSNCIYATAKIQRDKVAQKKRQKAEKDVCS